MISYTIIYIYIYIYIIYIFYRVNSYIKYGWDKNIVNPFEFASHSKDSKDSKEVSPGLTQHLMIPTNNWISILKVFKNTSDLPKFNNGHIVSYFVTRSVIDGVPSGDFKSINSSVENLFRCGHVQNIEVNTTDSTLLFLKASCLPEMRKDRIYSLNLALNNKLYDIVYASCGCPAGKGPNGSCKHIGAFCYAFCDFCKCGNIPDFLTCTDKLQSWNKPRARKVDPIPVDKLCSRRLELGNKGVSTSVNPKSKPSYYL